MANDLYAFERDKHEAGFNYVVGVDEVGRGPLAGPVVAAAVSLPKCCAIQGLTDSKKLTPKKRSQIYDEIMNADRVEYGLGCVSAEKIDESNE